jgi:hypothetical protein
MPSDFTENSTHGFALESVSCPDENDCVAVGTYGVAASGGYNSSIGLILTYAGGNWSGQEAPVPPDGNPEPPAVGMPLYAIDCADVGDCVAGGWYFDQSGNQEPLLVTLAGGVWSASSAPIPPDAQADPLAMIDGISCPAVGACVADGEYWVNFGAQVQSGMLLSQAGSTWTVSSASVPVTPFTRMLHASAHKRAKDSMYGISCVKASSCRAAGQSGKRAMIETLKRK